jgi:hypothetical protein
MAEVTQAAEPDANEILRAVRLRMETLRPLVAECSALEQADAALDAALAKLDGKRDGRRKRRK